MGRNAIETVLGAVVLMVAGMFVFFAYNTAQVKSVSGYEIEAAFYKIGGLTVGSDVRINGIKVGTVTSRYLDMETYDAMVTMSVSSDVKLPTDTIAGIGSEGILGGNYIRLQPGTDSAFLSPGDAIAETQDFRSLEDQVGEIIFLATDGPQ